ncbi:hypothetical protein [Paenibacillus eucommiae]|uniref:DUF3450 domain-containing protein n=1 Tax=Paenibacillus eucommiae TaxID=1355755 RepID=A0ABS4IVB6_9BACL|nr:hypothetical protein [Paenibacillus eucommiae]MBP1991517.1 hypothetical protein [Paenibacillus eucommiae]
MKSILKNKRLVVFALLVLILICVIVLQQREIKSLGKQVVETNNALKEKEQLAFKYKNEIATKENDALKLKADFELEKKGLNEQLSELKLVSTNLGDELTRLRSVMHKALLDGSERAPIVESSIPVDMLSVILNLYDAMQRDDIEKFKAIDVKGILSSRYENRDNIEKILWIRHDPESRAKAFKNDFGPESEVDLLEVIFLYKGGSTADPNYAMVKEHGKWVIFRED